MLLIVEPCAVGGGLAGWQVVGLGGELAADGRNVGEPALASALVEPELQRQFGDRQQRELLGSGVLGLTVRHSAIVAEGCDTVVG